MKTDKIDKTIKTHLYITLYITFIIWDISNAADGSGRNQYELFWGIIDIFNRLRTEV